MRRSLLSLLAASSLAIAIPAVANAQTWQPISQRQYEFDQRLDAAVRAGAVNRNESDRLRADFNALVRLEGDYRRSSPGLTASELQDLERRFDALSSRVGYGSYNRGYSDNRYDERYGYDDRNRYDDRYGRGGYDEPYYSDTGAWVSLEQRRQGLYRRIMNGERNGRLTRAEADRLRRDFDSLVRLETQYRNSGGVLTQNERADLNRRYRALSAEIRDERRDDDRNDRRDFDRIQADLERRIDAAYRSGRINRSEAERLRDELDDLERLEDRYRDSSPGMTSQEWRQIEDAIRRIEQRIGDGRYNNYNYND